MSSGEVRRVSCEDIQLVQNLIEQCLQLYMNKKEVVQTVLVQAKMDPVFTELVWQKLEEQNPEFFKAYHLRLMVRHHIMIFNNLLEKQVELLHTIYPDGVASVPNSNGSRTSSSHQTSVCYAPEHKPPPSRPESMHHQIGPSVPNTLINGLQNMHTADDISSHTRRMDVPPGMPSTQNSQMGMTQGMNGILIKSEAGYSSNSSFTFGVDGEVLEIHPETGDASVAQPLNDPLLDTDTSSFGFLRQNPRNFSLSELTTGISHDILESYYGSPYLATDLDNFPDYPANVECAGENKRMDTLSEGFNYE